VSDDDINVKRRKRDKPAVVSGDTGDATARGRMCSKAITGDTGDRSRSGGTSNGWGPVIPLPKMPPVPPFPVHVFHRKIAAYWEAAAAALSVPIDYVAVPGLTLLGAAVGRSRAVSVKSSYSAMPCFWSAVLAPPGSLKSPSLNIARAPLMRAEAKWIDQHREAVGIFDVEMDRYNLAMKTWKADCIGEPPAKPRRPTLRQATLDDATVEAVGKILNDNPRGVVMVKDELIAFVKALNQYRKGADREFYLSAWAGAPTKVSRSGKHEEGPLFIPHPFIGITGMMCPDLFAELRGENHRGTANADGFLDRFLLSFPDPPRAVAESYETIPPEVEAGYVEVFLDLLGMDLVSEADSPTSTRHRPFFISLSHAGQLAWTEFTGLMAEKMNAMDEFDPFKGVLSKIRGYGARFSALLWCCGRACGDIEQDRLIEPEIITGAHELTHYFEKHAARCWGRGWDDATTRVTRRLLEWLGRNPSIETFKRNEAYQALKDDRDVRTADVLISVFKLATDHNFIQPNIITDPRPGRPAETYCVNPDWDRAV
jgi:hypothetical protein